jgi:ADP-heptose:LPS heptosyltransferase
MRALRRRRYDLAVDFFGNPRSAALTFACGARRTAGYDLRGRRLAYRLRVPRSAPRSGTVEYAADAHVRLAAAVGGRADGNTPRLELPPPALAEADLALRAAGIARPSRAVGLIAGGTRATKVWPRSHAAALASALMRAGWEVVAPLGPDEAALGETLERLAPGVRVLPPRRDAVALAAVIARLGALVGTDSGPRHLAVALGVPSFAWFGPADPRTWTPEDPAHGAWSTDLPCRACHRDACPHWSCLPALSPARAAELVLAHLARHVRTAADLGPAAGA